MASSSRSETTLSQYPLHPESMREWADAIALLRDATRFHNGPCV